MATLRWRMGSRRSRVLSYSEVSRALDCSAAWDFAYGGHLAGSALKPKRVLPILSAGRAWGAGVAALQLNATRTDCVPQALDAIDASLADDADRQREFGVHDEQEHRHMASNLHAMLLHYAETAEPLPLDSAEHELEVPVPARSGGLSRKYRLKAFIDGVQQSRDGVWLVEFKLRSQLMSVELIALSRQIRWYAWAWQQTTGDPVLGVVVDERLNAVPKPPRVLKSGKLSHAKDQLATAAAYEQACRNAGEEPNPETVEALRTRQWQQRVPVLFRPGELDEAGRELTSAAKLIGMLDRGDLMPLRNAKRANCQGCQFREICPAPDSMLVDELFERRPPKRDAEEAVA